MSVTSKKNLIRLLYTNINIPETLCDLIVTYLNYKPCEYKNTDPFGLNIIITNGTENLQIYDIISNHIKNGSDDLSWGDYIQGYSKLPRQGALPSYNKYDVFNILPTLDDCLYYIKDYCANEPKVGVRLIKKRIYIILDVVLKKNDNLDKLISVFAHCSCKNIALFLVTDSVYNIPFKCIDFIRGVFIKNKQSLKFIFNQFTQIEEEIMEDVVNDGNLFVYRRDCPMNCSYGYVKGPKTNNIEISQIKLN